MSSAVSTEGAAMAFEQQRYPTYNATATTEDVLAEQQRVLEEALPIRGIGSVRGDLLNMGNNFSPLGAVISEVLVDTSGNPSLRAMLDAVRVSNVPLDIAIYAQWTITRSEEHWLALLYLNFEYGAEVAKFHLAFDLRDAKTRAILSQIEQSRQLTIDDYAAPPETRIKVAPATTAISLIRPQREIALVERMRGLTIEVMSSIVNAFSYSELFKLAVMHETSLEAAWPRLLYIDRQLTSSLQGHEFFAPPLDEHEALAATRQIELYLSFCSWYGNPFETGLGDVRMQVDRGISAVAVAQRPGWRQIALRGENLSWIPPFAVPAWEIVLTWKANLDDPWEPCLRALEAKFNLIPLDLMPMLYFIIQMARANDLELARAWAEAVPLYERGLMPLMPALVEEWSELAPERRHHPALSVMQLSPDLQQRVTFVRKLLATMIEPYDWRAVDIADMDVIVLRLIDMLARKIWHIDTRGIISALLAASAPDMEALTGIGLLDSLIVASAWQPNPPNPLLQQSVPPQLLPFLYFQHQLLCTDKLPCDAADLRFLTHDLTEQFGAAEWRRMLPWSGVERDNRPDAEREEQITAAVYWLLDQVTRARAKGVARPAAGRFEVNVPEGFAGLTHFGVERLRIVAMDGLLLVRLCLAPGLGGIVLPWVPSVEIDVRWRMLVPEVVIWELVLFLSAVYRDITVEGKEQVLFSLPPEPAASGPSVSRTRGRSAGNFAVPRPVVERVRLGRGMAPAARAVRHQWSTAEEREYIQKRKHGVKGKVVRMHFTWRASQKQRDLVKELGLPELPEQGITYRGPHTRGTDTPETVARPLRAKGLLIAMGVLDSISRKEPAE